MKYYLLTFNEDYGDEHNVPAIACMTEEEYNKWLDTPSGELNPDYDVEIADYNTKTKAYQDRNNRLQELGLWNKPANTVPSEHLEEYNELIKIPYVYADRPAKVESNMNAYLGNGGDCFEESYNQLYLMKEFVEAKLVKITEVNEDFYNIFHKANLADLSLCNVFTIDEY